MKAYYLNGKKYTKDMIRNMSIQELEELSVEIQENIQQCSLLRKRIHLFNSKKLNDVNKKKLMSCESKISIFYQMATFVGCVKKGKRDSMQKERDWYKEFFHRVDYDSSILIDDIIDDVNTRMGYTIEFY